MTTEIIFLITLLAGLSLFPYGVYLFGIKYGKKQGLSPALETYPAISVVISAYNEEPNIEKRLKNLKDCEYPDMEVVFVDDKSSDNTAEVAKRSLDQLGFTYQLILNQERRGTSGSYNRAIKAATHEIVVTTDADVYFKKNALHRIVARLMSDTRIGAVTGDLRPEPDEETTTELEQKYRSVYGKMCVWESAIDSTFNFNGALSVFRKKAIIWINQTAGADDANIAFAAIKNGYRAVYEQEAVVYEKVPATFKIQSRQKVRRATGLIESVLSNLPLMDIERPFAKFFFLRTWMYVISPSLLVFTGLLMVVSAVVTDPLKGLIIIASMVLLVISTPLNTAFFLNQYYLIRGLFNIGNNVQTWESTTSLNEAEK